MPMIACPGCGLPRTDERVGAVPCPICATVAFPEAEGAGLPFAAEIPADPTDGLPADVSQMEAHAARAAGRSRSRLAVGAAFLLGIAVGIGSLLAGQRVSRLGQPESVAQLAPLDREGQHPSPALPLFVAPMPHDRQAVESASSATPKPRPEPRPESKADPHPMPGIPALARIEPIQLNQPDAAYNLPRMEGKGEHIVLRGKVRMLRINGLGAGAILDASGLEAGSIYVCGTIDGGAFLKLNCPNGVVEIPAGVSEHARVEINAPGSSVRFVYPTTPDNLGSRIDGGATVAITARTVDLRGDVSGAGTQVKVTLTRNGSIKAAAVRGTAAVEYRAEDLKAPIPPAAAVLVAPTATFRKVE